MLTGLGLIVGSAAALLAGPLVRAAPLTVRTPDLITLVPVAMVIALVAAIAALVPALRASRVDPMAVLRSD